MENNKKKVAWKFYLSAFLALVMVFIISAEKVLGRPLEFFLSFWWFYGLSVGLAISGFMDLKKSFFKTMLLTTLLVLLYFAVIVVVRNYVEVNYV